MRPFRDEKMRGSANTNPHRWIIRNVQHSSRQYFLTKLTGEKRTQTRKPKPPSVTNGRLRLKGRSPTQNETKRKTIYYRSSSTNCAKVSQCILTEFAERELVLKLNLFGLMLYGEHIHEEKGVPHGFGPGMVIKIDHYLSGL
jgi:hypothetical protein